MNLKTAASSRSSFFLLLMFFSYTIHGQQAPRSGPHYIENLIAENKITEAKLQLATELAAFKKLSNYDTLVAYIPLTGSFTLSENNIPTALKKAEDLVLEIKQGNSNLHAKALLQLSNLYFTAKQHDKVLEASLEGVHYTMKSKPLDKVLLSTFHYNIGTAHLNLGDPVQAKNHLFKSRLFLEDASGKNLNEYYNIYNSTGRYYASISQLDSSTYYYKKAVGTLSKMDSTEVNRDYWKAIVHNNIALNLQNVGNTREALEFIQNSISDYQKFIGIAKDESKKNRAKRYRLASIDNLGTFYHGLGEFNRAVEVMEYSYREKIKLLGSDDPNVVFSLAILGHATLSAKNYTKAGDYLDKALELINKNPSNYSFLHSYTVALRASIFEASEQWDKAEEMYKKSESLYMRSFDGTYSKDYLDTMINMSLFYSKRGYSEKALSLAGTGYRYTKRDAYQNHLIHFHHIQNMANVNFALKKYSEALKYSEEALYFFNQNPFTSTSLSDSIQIEFIKPRSLLVNAKSKYHLQQVKSESFLKNLLTQVEEGITILERRKNLIKTPEDLQILIDDNNELFSFAKQVRLDLYEITKKDAYLLGLINAHESGMYNRIRSRLNIRNDLSFANIPKEVLEKESYLKKELSFALSKPKIENFNTFFEASTKWETFLDSLKHAYPKYYKMRYATIEESLDGIQQHIPKTTTVVRYFFIEENLYAFVVSTSEKKLFPLEFDNVKEYIPQLIENDFDAAKISLKLFELYQSLWKPFEDSIATDNVIIIPDKELFNLSFELLTSSPIQSFADLKTHSLLAKHTISYNFSLLLQKGEPIKLNTYPKNFVAFAPEFSEEMKEKYLLAVTDSASIDKSYLTLLPQPFSLDLVKQYSRMFKGNSFINEEASKVLFKKNAREHKIIHIGTHAESNNVSPELSRLIFAKNISGEKIEDNFLYTYEIYDQDLSSQLAILTACETGKPTYQAGEGMISLAHAFTYAGSESILTSLWKIDEKSSSEILASFYDNLANGMPKDRALKEAKLTYLSTANGRELSPQYWAGLVIMGDTSPLNLETGISWWYWVIGSLIIIFLLILFFKNRKA
jgi:CHAT domain-containing protein